MSKHRREGRRHKRARSDHWSDDHETRARRSRSRRRGGDESDDWDDEDASEGGRGARDDPDPGSEDDPL